MREFKNAWEKISTIHGHLTLAEAQLLYTLARDCIGKGVIVEIGTRYGRSTLALGFGSRRGKEIRVYTVDLPDPERVKRIHAKFQEHIEDAGLGDIIVPILKPSVEAAKDFDQPIELLYIDGSHAYEAVKGDFDSWFPKLIVGGIVAFHDSIDYGISKSEFHPWVIKVVKEYIYDQSEKFDGIWVVRRITYARKRGEIG